MLTIGLVGLYGLYRAATERGLRARVRTVGMAVALVGVGVLLSAVQWVPSKELLDRSPRAGGLSWEKLTYGSWHPELLPTLVVREAYGTRARDTDWMDGFYPYHEMNTYMGLIAIVLAVVGAGGGGRRDRWSNFWVVLIGVGGVLMLGKFTCLFDFAHRMPVLGSSREPVRFHLWVSLGVAALAAVGVERLGRPGAVSLRGGLMLAGRARRPLHPDHGLPLSPGLDRAETLDPAGSPRPIPMAGPRADRRLDSHNTPGGLGLVGRSNRGAGEQPDSPRPMGRAHAALGPG